MWDAVFIIFRMSKILLFNCNQRICSSCQDNMIKNKRNSFVLPIFARLFCSRLWKRRARLLSSTQVFVQCGLAGWFCTWSILCLCMYLRAAFAVLRTHSLGWNLGKHLSGKNPRGVWFFRPLENLAVEKNSPVLLIMGRVRNYFFI